MDIIKEKSNDAAHHYHKIVSDRLFETLDITSDGKMIKSDLLDTLEDVGLLKGDPRLKQMHSELNNYFDKQPITASDFQKITHQNFALIEKAIKGDMVIPEFKTFCKEITKIYKSLKSNKGGKVADYIPQLKKVDPDAFAISVCTVDGQQFSIGDDDIHFSAQSTCKPINYCLALEERGEDKVHEYIGREPSGHGFNEITLNSENKPHNPMINAGAIMACSLIKPDLTSASRFDYVLDNWQKLAGGKSLGFSNSVFLSERETSNRNFALGYFMKDQGGFPEGINLKEVLNFYFQCCSIEIDSKSQASVAATLANSGICPLTGEKIFSTDVTKNCLSLMFSCGMYDYSGEFAFKVGLPAKSGVSGSLMLVIPNVMGISIYSPRLDKLGNSVRGIEFCNRLIENYNFHNFDDLLNSSRKKDPRKRKYYDAINQINTLCLAASQGDLNEIKRLKSNRIPLDGVDYDGRGALHLAASEGRLHIIEYLIDQKINLSPKDHWGNTPLDDARRVGNKKVITLLSKNGAK